MCLPAFRVLLLATTLAGLGVWLGAAPILWTALALAFVAAVAALDAALGAKA